MLVRRRSPAFVRQMTSEALHGICGKLTHDQVTEDLSERQEWLWEAVLSELAYRNRRRGPGTRCTCQWCWGPFDFLEDDQAAAFDPRGLNQRR
jgi:hypothetical protein